LIDIEQFAAYRQNLLNLVEVVCSYSYEIVYIFKSGQEMKSK